MNAKNKIGDLVSAAKVSLSELLQFDQLVSEQWFMQILPAHKPAWELLASDSRKNEQRIREKIAGSSQPVNDLIFAFLGTVEWRGTKSLMAHGQYFRKGYANGLLFGHHLTRTPEGKWLARGNFLILGGCENLWL